MSNKIFKKQKSTKLIKRLVWALQLLANPKIAKLYQKKSFHLEIQEMLGKPIFVFAVLLYFKSNHNEWLLSIKRDANHCYMFNKSLKWLRQASIED